LKENTGVTAQTDMLKQDLTASSGGKHWCCYYLVHHNNADQSLRNKQRMSQVFHSVSSISNVLVQLSCSSLWKEQTGFSMWKKPTHLQMLLMRHTFWHSWQH